MADTPSADISLKAVCFGKIALKAVPLHLAHTLFEHIGVKTAVAGGSNDRTVRSGKLCLNKALLAELSEAVQIGIVDLDCHMVFVFRKRQRKLIDAIKAVCTARRAEMHKRAVDKQVIKTACRSFEGIGSGAERCAAKADGDISFVSKRCVPYRECLFKKLHDFSSLFPFFNNIGSVQFILPQKQYFVNHKTRICGRSFETLFDAYLSMTSVFKNNRFLIAFINSSVEINY